MTQCGGGTVRFPGMEVRVKRGVAQATRLFRRATRPTEWGAASNGRLRYSRTRASRPVLPASRREGRAGRPHHPGSADKPAFKVLPQAAQIEIKGTDHKIFQFEHLPVISNS